MSENELRETVHGLMGRAREDLERLVSIPSIADPRQVPAERCLEAADFVKESISAAGMDECRLLDIPDGHPAVFGQAPAPDGAPTVLLYCHYDVQPPLDEQAWQTPPFELTEREDGRWYGRGAADCKGNIAMHLTALRALGGGEFPVGIKLICEGAEEQATGGLEEFVAGAGELLAADAVLVCDTGNFAVGVPTLTTTLRGLANVTVTVRTLSSAMHSGMFGGPAPDALVALVRMLATLHNEHGDTTVTGLDGAQRWSGVDYPAEQFRSDANVLDGVQLIGSGSVSDMLWARPSVSVLGIDCPPVVGSAAALAPQASARVSMRVPPGMDPAEAQDALVAHLQAVAPWGAQVEIEREAPGSPFQARTGGPAYAAMADAMKAAYGREMTTEGQGGSIPLCNVFAETLPDAEIILMGVEEPRCLIHAPNESVDPGEIERMSLVEALFLTRYAEAVAG